MNQSVMVLGGYGNFGKRICLALAKANISIIIVGRDHDKALNCANDIKKNVPNAKINIDTSDINIHFNDAFQKLKPTIVINTVGPFQGANYDIVNTCIQHRVHYLDLADARDFVVGISQLDELAKQNNVLVVSGASSVPGLSSAVVSHFKNKFSQITHMRYGISTAQKTANGLATASAILSYLGKPMKPFAGSKQTVYGWQNLYCQTYPLLGRRWMASCDVPDLDLLPKQFNIQNIEFSAGVESTAMHFCMWLTSWCIRLGLPIDLSRHAKGIQKICRIFNVGCKNKSGMHIILEGLDPDKKSKRIKWFIIAEYGEGLEIPTIPAIVLAKKILNGKINMTGAMPCVDLLTLEEYLEELNDFAIQIFYEEE
jgi:hypothetical protein